MQLRESKCAIAQTDGGSTFHLALMPMALRQIDPLLLRQIDTFVHTRRRHTPPSIIEKYPAACGLLRMTWENERCLKEDELSILLELLII